MEHRPSNSSIVQEDEIEIGIGLSVGAMSSQPNTTDIPKGVFSNSSSTPPALNGITTVEFWILLVVFYAFLAGVLCTIGNLCIGVGIVRAKNLRTRFFIILCYLAFVRALLSFQQFILFVHRTLREFGLVDVSTTRVTCYFVHFHLYYCTTLEMVLLLGLVVDRVLAIVAYKYYRTLNYKQANLACAIACVITVMFKLVPSFFSINFNEVVPCMDGGSPMSRLFLMYHSYSDLILALMILFIYIWLICYARFCFLPQQTTQQRSGHHEAMVGLQMQLRLLALLKRLVLIHLGFTMFAKVVILYTFLTLNSNLAKRLIFYCTALTAGDLFANIVMLLATNKDLRTAAFRSIPCSSGSSVFANPIPAIAPQSSACRATVRKYPVIIEL